MSIPHNNQGPPPTGPPPPNNNGPPPVVRPKGSAPRSMEGLCQPSINGWGGPIALIPIQATDFGLLHHMIQQVQNTCQFHGLPGDDANRHIDKFLEVTQHMKQNGVSDDALRLSLFPYSLTHHATAWYDGLLRNSIQSFDDMMRKFLSKYFPPSMDTINASAGGTFMQKTLEECYELMENMTAHHNYWDTSATQDKTSRTISSTTESSEVVRQLEMMNKIFLDMMRQIQLVKSALNFQAPNYQAQVGPSNDLSNYKKTNDVNMRAMQNQINNMKTELKKEFQTSMKNQNNELRSIMSNELKNVMTNFLQMQNPSGSGSLPSNTVANPRGDLKAITTQSDVSYDGPTIPPSPSHLPKEVEHETKATKDKEQTTSLESIAHVQPSVVQILILKPEVAPKPNPKPLIPYPSRLNDQSFEKKLIIK
ncbi:hypothetical protein Tco_0418744, partial [Tanacetum coccineum]